MDKVKALIKYNKQTLIRHDEMDALLKKIVDDMEKMILKDIALALKNQEPTISIVDKLYRAEFWKDNQELLYSKKATLLDKFFKIYKKDIDDLKAIYPEADFSISAIDYQLEKFDSYLDNELDLIKMMNVTESQAKGLIRMSQFGAVTDSEDLISLIQNNIDKPISNLKTRLYTTQSAIYRKNRQNFFGTIKEQDKKYIYVGPQDGLTRPFCASNGGKMKSKTEWRNLSNGQIGSAWNFGGGYNCRHYVLLVTKNWSSAEVKQLILDFS